MKNLDMIPKVLASPSRYIQGPGELSRIRGHLSNLGGPLLFVMGGFAYDNLKGIIEESYKNSGIHLIFERFCGECTRNEITRLGQIYSSHGCTATIGVGGGKALDTAKGVAYYESGPVISIPTIASTDAPTSAISVTYTETHVFDGNLLLPRSPEIVLVDTDIIMQAPVRYLIAGMGDALSTYFEAKANVSSDHPNFAGGKSSNTSLALAKLCYEILIRDGLTAKKSVENKIHSKELENIIEANIYLSGVGFESNGLACAHSIYNAMTVLPHCHQRYHGELVAFGTLVQLILENHPDDVIGEVLQFCTDIGLPVTFAEVSDGELSREDLMKIAHSACNPNNFMDSEPFQVTPEMVFNALITADKTGNAYKKNNTV